MSRKTLLNVALIKVVFPLSSGTIGFFACFWFVTKIYSVVKVDWRLQTQQTIAFSSFTIQHCQTEPNITSWPFTSAFPSTREEPASDSLLCLSASTVCVWACVRWVVILFIQYLSAYNLNEMNQNFKKPLPSIWLIVHCRSPSCSTAGLSREVLSVSAVMSCILKFVLWSMRFACADVVGVRLSSEHQLLNSYFSQTTYACEMFPCYYLKWFVGSTSPKLL